MAHALTNTAAVNGLGLIDRARNAVAQYRTYRQTVNELEALSNRELADLGLSRALIRDIARTSAYGL
jgi:uncharacterized protein YjiS (DUF1127 family)